MQRVSISVLKRWRSWFQAAVDATAAGRVEQMRVDVLLKLSQARTIDRVSGNFSSVSLVERIAPTRESKQAYADLKQEYQRLQVQLEQQRQALWQNSSS